MDDESANTPTGELEPRAPTQADLVALCRRLNELGAKYLVVGGFAVIRAGYPRFTGDIDLVIGAGSENEARVYQALEIFADKAVRELDPGDVEKYTWFAWWTRCWSISCSRRAESTLPRPPST